jgi:hypothetical protein
VLRHAGTFCIVCDCQHRARELINGYLTDCIGIFKDHVNATEAKLDSSRLRAVK